MKKWNKLLILCIDRDNDLGEKAGVDGPIFGREENLQAAMKLALVDPEDADVNTIFEAVKLYDELAKDIEQVNVATITGHRRSGTKADLNLSGQLDGLLKRFPADGVIAITDGAADEYILPIIRSRVNIAAVRRVIVKQSQRLENAYVVLYRYIREVFEDPLLRKLIVGIPGSALLIWALLYLLGIASWKIGAAIVATIGAYFLFLGFKLERYLETFHRTISQHLATRRLSLFTYMLASLVSVVAVFVGYVYVKATTPSATIQIIATFFAGGPFWFSSSFWFWFSAAIAGIGRIIDAYLAKEAEAGRHITTIIFSFAFFFVLYYVCLFILGKVGFEYPLAAIVVGIIMCIFAAKMLAIKPRRKPSES